MNIIISGTHHSSDLLSVNLPIDNNKYHKICEGLDAEAVNDGVYDWFEPFLSYSGLKAWFDKNYDSAWFDILEDEEDFFYAAAGDNEGIKFLESFDFFTIEYDGYEINIERSFKGNYVLGFFIDPDGGILLASDEERGAAFYESLHDSEKCYSKQEYTLKSALDDLIAHSDEYQNPECEEDEDCEDNENCEEDEE